MKAGVIESLNKSGGQTNCADPDANAKKRTKLTESE